MFKLFMFLCTYVGSMSKMASAGIGFKPRNVAMALTSSMYVSTPGDALLIVCSHASVILNSMPSFFFVFGRMRNMITHANLLSRNNMFTYDTQI
jgi:hypothetical protein